MKVLLVSTCKEKLHELEFVKPIGDIVEGICEYKIKNYGDLNEDFVNSFDKVIICGTSLQDDGFLENLSRFNWLKEFKGNVLGICAGMQILGLIFEGEIKQKTEIGYYFENFKKDFLGLEGKQEVYHLHNNFVEFSEDFERFTSSEIVQAVKHKENEFYGVLFHPEVRNKNLVREFIKK